MCYAPQTGKGHISGVASEHQGLESEALGVSHCFLGGCPGPFPGALRTHVLSVLLAALIPGERTEREEGSGCGCLLPLLPVLP